MREKWKRLWVHRPRLSRGQKTARNFLLCLPILTLFWGLAGYPLPTAELEFRRMERTHLLPRSEIVFSNWEGLQVSGQDGAVFALDGTKLSLRGRWMAGVQGDWVAVACLSENGRYIRRVPLSASPSLVPFLWRGEYLDHIGYWVSHGPGETPEGDPAYVYHYHNFAPLLLLNAPEGTSGAEITVRLAGEAHSGGGWQLADGVWLLGIELEQRFGDKPADETAYTLRLYRADGSLLLEKSGMLGEG